MKENNSIRDNNVFETIPRSEVPKGRRIIRGRYVYKAKAAEDGYIASWKARLVAQGFLCVPQIDFTETYAPTARSVTVRLVLAMAAILNLDLRQFDVETAFLGAPLKEEIYMEAPYGLDGIPTGHVLRIKRSLYGLPQASRCFWTEMDTHLLKPVDLVQVPSTHVFIIGLERKITLSLH